MALDLSKVDVEDMLHVLELRNITQPTLDEVRFSCPYPAHAHGDEKPSCYMNVHTTKFHCHGCKESGDAKKLVSYITGVNRLVAARWLREAYDGDAADEKYSVADNLRRHQERKRRQKEDEEENDEVLDESFVDEFAIDWQEVDDADVEDVPEALLYMFNRGFAPETLTEWEFGYDPQGDRITFPVRDEQGQLRGFKGRAWEEDRHPKYLVLGDRPDKKERYGFPLFTKSRYLFGLNRAGSQDTLILCEGELNAIMLHQHGYDNAVAISGSYTSKRQLQLLKRYADKLILFFDSDKAGEECAWGRIDTDDRYHEGIVQQLKPFMPVLIVPEHDGDPASMDRPEIEQCITEAVNARQLENPIRSHLGE